MISRIFIPKHKNTKKKKNKIKIKSKRRIKTIGFNKQFFLFQTAIPAYFANEREKMLLRVASGLFLQPLCFERGRGSFTCYTNAKQFNSLQNKTCLS